MGLYTPSATQIDLQTLRSVYLENGTYVEGMDINLKYPVDNTNGVLSYITTTYDSYSANYIYSYVDFI